MTAAAAVKQHTITIERADVSGPILYVAGKDQIGIRAGTVVNLDDSRHAFDVDTIIGLTDMLMPGHDYGISILEDGRPVVVVLGATNPITAGFFAGFHFAPSGCAKGNAGGDGVAAINPYSIWDIDYRPACPDPRGMACVVTAGGAAFWADIYLLGVEHLQSTSRFGATIADGRSLPEKIGGKSKYSRLDYATAVEIYAHHGKRLLGAEEFFAAAYGVKERCSRDEEPETAGTMEGNAARFVSRFGLCDATGSMWQWGTDGHPDDPRASFFGGSWISGSRAGSRCAHLDYWAGHSDGHLSARGASDHLHPA